MKRVLIEKFLILTVTLFIMVSCLPTGSKNTNPDKNSITETLSLDGQIMNETDSTKQVQLIMEFFNWYKLNYELLRISSMISYVETDTVSFFQLDTILTNQYLELFKESGFFSENYLLYWNKYFSERGNYLKSNIDLEIPEGFDHDFVLMTQEIEKTLSAIDSLKVIKIQNNSNICIVDINIYMNLRVYLKRINNSWYIDSISNRGFKR